MLQKLRFYTFFLIIVGLFVIVLITLSVQASIAFPWFFWLLYGNPQLCILGIVSGLLVTFFVEDSNFKSFILLKLQEYWLVMKQISIWIKNHLEVSAARLNYSTISIVSLFPVMAIRHVFVKFSSKVKGSRHYVRQQRFTNLMLLSSLIALTSYHYFVVATYTRSIGLGTVLNFGSMVIVVQQVMLNYKMVLVRKIALEYFQYFLTLL